jgi:hypothetical protein
MHYSPQRVITRALCAGLVVLAALFAPAPRRALACTPPPGGLPTFSLAERTQAADIVVEGEVIALGDAAGIPGATATIQVRQYLKGAGPEQLTVTGYGPTSLCLSELFAGDVRVFYIVNDGAGGLRALYLSQFDAAAPATAFLISQVSTAAAAQAPEAVQPAQAQPYPYPYPPPAAPTTAVPTLPPPTFVPPTFAPQPPQAVDPMPPPSAPDALPTIGSATAGEAGVPIPATSIGARQAAGPFVFMLFALALAGTIAYIRHRFGPPR